MKNFQPSEYQEAIARFVQSGEGNAIVNAVAGSGKSTTLTWLAGMIDGGIFVAFNSHIAKELGAKLKRTGSSMSARTIHSVGNSAFYAQGIKTRPDASKYRRICKEYFKDFDGMDYAEKRNVAAACNKVLSLCMTNLVAFDDATGIDALCKKHAIDLDEAYFRFIPSLFAIGEREAEKGIISFDEMIFLPIRWGS